MFIFCFFGHESSGKLVPQPGIKPIPLALEDQILTTGLQGKSLQKLSFAFHIGEELNAVKQL